MELPGAQSTPAFFAPDTSPSSGNVPFEVGGAASTSQALAVHTAKRPVERAGQVASTGAKKRASKPVKPLPADAIVTDKSCLRCRIRKVKCDRLYPVCSHCVLRKEECDLSTFSPNGKATAPSNLHRKQVARLEERLAQLEKQIASRNGVEPVDSQQAPVLNFADLGLDPMELEFGYAPELLRASNSPETNVDIGETSLDWRLATPQMASSLSQHLCEAFFDSCCALLPPVAYFTTRKEAFRGDLSALDGASKVAVAAFCAVGARASVHSALLGIATYPDDSIDHPEAPLLNAGTRRQSACDALVAQALTLGYEEGLVDVPTRDNLAALLALIQMMMFIELNPKKSRSFLRAAVGHFKELQDAAATEDEKDNIKRSFALAIYYADSGTSAWGRKACVISPTELNDYFGDAGIVVPQLPHDDLLPVLENLLGTAESTPKSFPTAVHLVSCWTCQCQRMFAAMSCSPRKSLEAHAASITELWTVIDQTRAAIQYAETMIYISESAVDTDGSSGSLSSSHHHSHETDYVSQIIRSDRDLLDIVSMLHTFILRLPSPGLPHLAVESTSRVRKGLKILAYYAKLYTSGADFHMIFHHTFQLEHNPDWTKMALQRVGDVGGPLSAEEEVSEAELGWLVDGLQHACFYASAPEQRLAELSARPIPLPVAEPSPFPTWDAWPAPSAAVPAASDLTINDPLHALDLSTVLGTDTYASMFADGLAREWDAQAAKVVFEKRGAPPAFP